MEYEVIMGLEVHCELATKTKIFCSCKNEFGGEPNTHCCPVCMGMPGTLPVLNKKVVELGVKAGIATNCDINLISKFERKHYFYPDLPGAYQLTQMFEPICKNGRLYFNVSGKEKSARINRIHLEEDAGKLVHMGDAGTLVDCNRGGVPLIEIVTEPDLHSPEDGIAFLETLKETMIFANVSECKMEQGKMRCDINISLRPFGSTEFGTRVEMKNVASLKAAERAMKYEIKRQKKFYDRGEGNKIVQETRRWDDNKGVSYTMRSKEDALDYKYFPDSNLVPVVLSKDYVENIKNNMPKLPRERRNTYINEYGLPEYDASVLTSNKVISNFFDETVENFNKPKIVSNWIMTSLMRNLKDNKEDIIIPITAKDFADLLSICDNGTISNNIAVKVFNDMWNGLGTPKEIIDKNGLAQISDSSALEKMVDDAIKNNPKAIEDFMSGNKKAIGFLMGQIMKVSKGKANPQVVNKMLIDKLNNL